PFSSERSAIGRGSLGQDPASIERDGETPHETIRGPNESHGARLPGAVPLKGHHLLVTLPPGLRSATDRVVGRIGQVAPLDLVPAGERSHRHTNEPHLGVFAESLSEPRPVTGSDRLVESL